MESPCFQFEVFQTSQVIWSWTKSLYESWTVETDPPETRSHPFYSVRMWADIDQAGLSLSVLTPRWRELQLSVEGVLSNAGLSALWSLACVACLPRGRTSQYLRSAGLANALKANTGSGSANTTCSCLFSFGSYFLIVSSFLGSLPAHWQVCRFVFVLTFYSAFLVAFC